MSSAKVPSPDTELSSSVILGLPSPAGPRCIPRTCGPGQPWHSGCVQNDRNRVPLTARSREDPAHATEVAMSKMQRSCHALGFALTVPRRGKARLGRAWRGLAGRGLAWRGKAQDGAAIGGSERRRR
jgi:hypothetical protein